jgi:hypothetical protein
VSVAILEVSALIIFEEVSDVMGAIVESFETVVVSAPVESELEEPPLQAAKNAETHTIIRNFFILI